MDIYPIIIIMKKILSKRTILSQFTHLCVGAVGGGRPVGQDISGFGGTVFCGGRLWSWFAPNEGALPGGVPNGMSIRDCGLGGIPN